MKTDQKTENKPELVWDSPPLRKQLFLPFSFIPGSETDSPWIPGSVTNATDQWPTRYLARIIGEDKFLFLEGSGFFSPLLPTSPPPPLCSIMRINGLWHYMLESYIPLLIDQTSQVMPLSDLPLIKETIILRIHRLTFSMISERSLSAWIGILVILTTMYQVRLELLQSYIRGMDSAFQLLFLHIIKPYS